MTNLERRLKVYGGRYEFVRPAHAYQVDILRYGEPWVQNLDGANAITSIMSELDAARVVLSMARHILTPGANHLDPIGMLRRAVHLHDNLVDDREPATPWCGTHQLATDLSDGLLNPSEASPCPGMDAEASAGPVGEPRRSCDGETLRRGCEAILADDTLTSGQLRRAMRDLLDGVGARDSLACSQSSPGSPTPESPALESQMPLEPPAPAQLPRNARRQLHVEALHIPDRDGPGSSVDLVMHDVREAWMPEDYEAFTVNVLMGDGSMDLTYIQTLDEQSGLRRLSDRWQRFAEALRKRADRPQEEP